MKASELINLKSEILEPLHVVAAELAELDTKGKGHTIEYTDLDVKAAAVTFIHIMANRKAHQYFRVKTQVDIDEVEKEMFSYGRRISDLVREMSGVHLNEEQKNE